MPRVLYLDIETTMEYPDWNKLPEDGQIAFKKKFKSHPDVVNYKPKPKENSIEGSIDAVLNCFDEAIEACYYKHAALYAEWSKIICIGLGSIILDTNGPDPKKEVVYLKCISGSELEIFSAFVQVIEKGSYTNLCAHNGKGFDYPFICRRMLINGFKIPDLLQIAGLKPWEIKLIDTNTLWQFGEVKHYVSLITLCHVFNMPSPKQLMEGSEVPAAYYAGKIEEIKVYCLEDVFSDVNIHRAMQYLPPIDKWVKREKKVDPA